MDKKELKKAFKKFKKIVFIPEMKDLRFFWQEDSQIRGVPGNNIFVADRKFPIPIHKLTPYDIEKLECTKPSLFKFGKINIIGTDGRVIDTISFKEKSNMKSAALFNEYLALYKQYGLGK